VYIIIKIFKYFFSIIAAGFTNGYIALWNLSSTSPFLLNVQGKTKFLNAFKHFFAHHNAVMSKCVYPICPIKIIKNIFYCITLFSLFLSLIVTAIIPYHGSRYLASASTDTSYKFWDLENTSVPQNCTKKGIIVNGVWMTHWPCAFLSFDDALG